MQDNSSTITQEDDLSRILAASDVRPQIIFKHSIACAVSSNAYKEVEDFLDNPRFHMLIVQDQPDLKMVIQELFNIKHESPQIMIIEKRHATKVFNHQAIRKEDIEKYLD